MKEAVNGEPRRKGIREGAIGEGVGSYGAPLDKITLFSKGDFTAWDLQIIFLTEF